MTFRSDAALLDDARRRAAQENRSLTRFIETPVKTHMAARIDSAGPLSDPRVQPFSPIS